MGFDYWTSYWTFTGDIMATNAYIGILNTETNIIRYVYLHFDGMVPKQPWRRMIAGISIPIKGIEKL
jgi:hypothetical protein